MARKGDKGAYEVGNVRIITVEQNHREMRHTKETKAEMSAKRTGRKHKASTRAYMSKKMKGNKNALGHKQSFETIAKRIKTRYGHDYQPKNAGYDIFGEPL